MSRRQDDRNSDQRELVDRFDNMTVGTPASGSRNNEDLLSMLQIFFDNNGDIARKFLSNFPRNGVGRQRRQTFLRLFTSGEKIDGLYAGGEFVDYVGQLAADTAQDRPILMKLPYLASLKSATDFLDADIPAPLTTAGSTRSSQSTKANDLFNKDPIMLRYFSRSSSDYYDDARLGFTLAIEKVDTFFYDDPMERWVEREGDVTYAITILE
jgi:hypothetical protein